MPDWLKKLFNEPATLGIIMTSGIVGLFIGVVQGNIQRRHGGWPGFFGALLTGVAVAVISGLAIQSFVASEPLRLAVVGICALVSEDIIAGLKALGGGVRTDPIGFFIRVFDALRGRVTIPRSGDLPNYQPPAPAPGEGEPK